MIVLSSVDDFFLVQCPFSMVSKREISHFYLWSHNRGRGKSMNLIRFVFLILLFLLYYRNKHFNSALFHDSYLKFESLSFKGKMKIKVTPISPFPLHFMGGRTEKEDSKKNFRNLFLCVAERSCNFFLFL